VCPVLSPGRVDLAICDVGLGNLRSVERALVRAATDAGIAANVTITRDTDVIRRADKVVVPGQGAFRDCARSLDVGLGEVLKERIAAGVPYLGICLGMQVLFASSEEAPGACGLGVLAGAVVKLRGGDDPVTGGPLKIPHMGWNHAIPGVARALVPETPEHFYFVHSYAVVPEDPSIIAATTDYGVPFVSAVAKDNVFACQFHPEKSQAAGLALLRRFLQK
jgi:glutamine amidotransferase